MTGAAGARGPVIRGPASGYRGGAPREGAAVFDDPLTQTLADFVRGVGIEVRAADLPHLTFMPGLDMDHGVLLVDEKRMMSPGDILHEAGHLALKAPEERAADPFRATGAEEISVLAWSYAAALHIGLDLKVLFHGLANGDLHEAILDNFPRGQFIGLPMLQRWGMTVEPRLAVPGGPAPFPHMLRWVR